MTTVPAAAASSAACGALVPAPKASASVLTNVSPAPAACALRVLLAKVRYGGAPRSSSSPPSPSSVTTTISEPIMSRSRSPLEAIC